MLMQIAYTSLKRAPVHIAYVTRTGIVKKP